jgi:predicted GNAT superfamily acetyltransferase
VARAAADQAGVTLRALRGPIDADAITRVIQATWGESESLSREMVVALAAAGNAPYGAFDGDQLIGFVLGWAGITPEDGLHVHSHQLATLPGLRHKGVGYALKLAQAAQALDQGITLVRWTFDPLVSRNAWFNITKLGASADRFLPDFYGQMADSINVGERSDRLLVRWELEGRDPVSLIPTAEATPVLRRSTDGGPGEVGEPPSEGPASIQVPREYHELRAKEPEVGRLWRDATSSAFTACFGAGFKVVGFNPDSTYLLDRSDR